MNSEELKSAYNDLYSQMANSNKPENMRLFGKVMTEMMEDIIENDPSLAEEYIEKLSSIKWKQYLTANEAERIVESMKPEAPWSREVWNSAMDSLGLVKEEEPYYNRYALWTEMNKQYSDHGESVASLLGKPLKEIPADVIVPAMNKMALDLLRDKDGVYDIRAYFSL